MKKTAKLLALLLACLMLVSIIAACGNTGTPEDSTAAAQTSGSSDTEPEGSTQYDPAQHINKEDLGKDEIKLLTPIHDWAVVNLTAEEISGDIIQDEICDRQARVEDFLNCTLVETNIGDVTSRLMTTAAASGDDAFNIALVPTDKALSLFIGGYTVDQSKLDNINLDNPWWESSFNKEVNLTGARYITFSNASLIYYSSFYIFCFNKGMIDSYNLDNPYDLVRSGDWTWDKAYEMMKVVATDVGNDGLCNPGTDDILGLTGHINHSRNIMFSSGYTICERNSDGKLTYEALSQNYIDAFNKYMDYFISSPYVAIAGTATSRYSGYTSTAGIKNYVNVFVEGKSLFLTTGTNEVMQIRDTDEEYGIVVVPKYSKDQTKYNTPVYSATAGFVIPKSAGNVEKSALVLEALGAFSYQNIVDKHISVVLHYRVAQDPTAIEMINIAYANGTIDTAMANNFGTCTNMLNNLHVQESKSITTLFGAIKKKLNDDIKNAYKELGE